MNTILSCVRLDELLVQKMFKINRAGIGHGEIFDIIMFIEIINKTDLQQNIIDFFREHRGQESQEEYVNRQFRLEVRFSRSVMRPMKKW